MATERTKAERALDELNAEANRLRHKRDATAADHARLIQVQIIEIPKARRAVALVREREKVGRRYF